MPLVNTRASSSITGRPSVERPVQPRASSAPTKGTVEAKPGYDKRGNIYPTNVKRGWVKFVTKEGKIDRQYRIKGVKGCQDHHILSDKNKWIINQAFFMIFFQKQSIQLALY